MKWIGQHIYDLVSRFRDDVYLEDLSTTTETNVLVVNSDGKVSKSTSVAGDLTSIVAGTGLGGTSLTGPIPTLNILASQPTITTLAGLTSFGSVGATTNVLAGDLTIYNAVNNGNPTLSIGSSATDRFEMVSTYNSGAQTLDQVEFKTYTTSPTTNDGRYLWYVDEVLMMGLLDTSLSVYGDTVNSSADAQIIIADTGGSGSTKGGKLILRSDDGAAMGYNHRLGVIEFKGAEDASNNRVIGARIEAVTDDAWSATENGASLRFSTTDGDQIQSEVLRLDSDKLATFTGDLAVGGDDVTIYNAFNDSNPTISLGSSATNRFEIKTAYNSGAQTLDEVYFNTYTTSGTTNDGRYIFQVDEVEMGRFLDGGISWSGFGAFKSGLIDTNETASSATEGGKLQLQSDDGAAMGDDHRLGVIEFLGAEDGSSTYSIGARIQAICRDAWDGSNNDADLEFYTTDGTTESKVLTLDADKLATFTGAVTATGALTGTLATVSQPNITGVGTIDTGVWRGTAITSTYLDADTAHLSGTQTFTGTKTLNSFKGTGGATVTNILDEDAMGSDSATALATQQSIKAYADRPAKQIVLMRAAFKDDIGTAKHYIPLQSELEQTNSFHEMNSFVAPFDGKLLKLMYNGSGNFSGGEFSFTLEQIPRNVAFATTPTVLETIAIDGPTNDTTDPNMIIANFVGGSGTNSFTAGDLIMVGIQSDADVTSSTSKHFFTLVFEFDFSSLA